MRLSELIAKAQADLEENGDREVRIATGARSLYPNAVYDPAFYDNQRVKQRFVIGIGARRADGNMVS